MKRSPGLKILSWILRVVMSFAVTCRRRRQARRGCQRPAQSVLTHSELKSGTPMLVEALRPPQPAGVDERRSAYSVNQQ